jgi:hypothetical protein
MAWSNQTGTVRPGSSFHAANWSKPSSLHDSGTAKRASALSRGSGIEVAVIALLLVTFFSSDVRCQPPVRSSMSTAKDSLDGRESISKGNHRVNDPRVRSSPPGYVKPDGG